MSKMADNAFVQALSKPVPQTEQAHPLQVQNNAGGFTFTVSDADRLRRFLILGVDGGTYYVDEKKLTKDSVAFVRAIIMRDEESERMVINVVRDVSITGASYRNSACIFTVAALFAYGKLKPRELVRDVCRTSTHLFEFAEYVELLGGWGPAKRKAVSEWYTSKSPDSLAYQAVKYRQRNGWTHRDLLRLAHPQGKFGDGVGEFILGKDTRTAAQTEGVPEIIKGFRFAQEAETVSELLGLALRDYPNLPWEAIPTQYLKNADVWKKLFYNGQLKGQALVRNITRLARMGAFDDMVFAADYASRLTDEEMISKTRLHPIQYLLAQTIHQNGQKDKRTGYRNKDWTTSSVIIDALDAGFYKAFKYVEPANKRTFIGLDVSGSMTWEAAGTELTAAQMGAAMAMTIMRTEPYYAIHGFSDTLRELPISASMNLNNVLTVTNSINFGRTDCALPMLYAKERNIQVDTFVVITDNETWFGNVHPHVALELYRQATGILAKLIVVACAASQFTIANPTDRGMLDVVGADANLPSLIASFSRGF